MPCFSNFLWNLKASWFKYIGCKGERYTSNNRCLFANRNSLCYLNQLTWCVNRNVFKHFCPCFCCFSFSQHLERNTFFIFFNSISAKYSFSIRKSKMHKLQIRFHRKWEKKIIQIKIDAESTRFPMMFEQTNGIIDA